MKVLHIVTAFPYRKEEVLTPWLWGLLRKLQEHGVSVHILASANMGMKGEDLWGFRVHRYRYAPARWETFTYEAAIPEMLKHQAWRWLLIPPYLLGGYIQAQRLARKERYDVVHVHWPIPLAIFALPFRSRNIPILHTYYTAELTLAKKIKPLVGPLVYTADHWIAISTYAARLLQDLVSQEIPKERLSILPFSAAVSNSKMEAPRGKIQGPRILFVGRMVERKGVPVLFKAVKLLIPRYPDLLLTLVGDGPERESWERLAHDLSITHQVRFLGRISDKELDLQYKQAEIFVLPAIVDSRGDTEGLGVVLLEALQYGLPVVASRVGGIVDIVQHEKTGLLVPEKDPKALARAIERYIQDPQLAVQTVQHGQDLIKRQFSVDALSLRLLKLYQAYIPS